MRLEGMPGDGVGASQRIANVGMSLKLGCVVGHHHNRDTVLAHVFHDRIDMAGIAFMCGACIMNVTNQQGQMLDLLNGLV
jgi:hypothetical protein